MGIEMIIVTAEIWCDAHRYALPRCSSMFHADLILDRPLSSVREVAKEQGWWRDPKSRYPRHLCPACRAALKVREKSDRNQPRPARVP
jgi:hypothetical protein